MQKKCSHGLSDPSWCWLCLGNPRSDYNPSPRGKSYFDAEGLGQANVNSDHKGFKEAGSKNEKAKVLYK